MQAKFQNFVMAKYIATKRHDYKRDNFVMT